MAYFVKSIAQHNWPKERGSMHLCAKCGDSFQLDLQELDYDKILHRVRSGYSPERLECSVYSKLLDGAKEKMDRCQMELRRLRVLLKELETQQDFLEAYIAGARSMVSPIHSFPVELMGEIFKWYNLVTSMPVLWSSFGSHALTDASTSSLFNVFLQRSQSHPIDFKLFDGYYSSGMPRHVLASLTAIETTNRWRHVQITGPRFAVKEILQALIDSGRSLPELVSLNLDVNVRLSFPVDCPNLRFLTLHDVSLDLEYPRLTVTYLDLMGLSPKETSQLIRCCPNIQVLVLRELLERKEEEAIAPISCNTAKFTVAFGDSYDGVLPIFDSLTFPELNHLELLGPRQQTIEPKTFLITSLCSMLERSQSQLTHLTIPSVPSIAADLLRIFLCVPSVTTLERREDLEVKEVEDHSSDEEEGGRAKIPHLERMSEQCLLPQLKDLSMVIRSCHQLESLLELVRSRWRRTDRNSRVPAPKLVLLCRRLGRIRLYIADFSYDNQMFTVIETLWKPEEVISTRAEKKI
ncbi:hypothetical protein BT96DRAFT_969709 [Gymnopus androsaceus JB14]|uniref:F-box domain-containing protein n=1 Tax=Gymnopus androsaceus JB14 TaxID=1447944 RepID=A0A6A4IJ23_9AGAR|nr:hypothetical protein BT96DRAFT_969709 [Gymnopus androsaceus JB14]